MSASSCCPRRADSPGSFRTVLSAQEERAPRGPSFSPERLTARRRRHGTSGRREARPPPCRRGWSCCRRRQAVLLCARASGPAARGRLAPLGGRARGPAPPFTSLPPAILCDGRPLVPSSRSRARARFRIRRDCVTSVSRWRSPFPPLPGPGW